MKKCSDIGLVKCVWCGSGSECVIVSISYVFNDLSEHDRQNIIKLFILGHDSYYWRLVLEHNFPTYYQQYLNLLLIK